MQIPEITFKIETINRPTELMQLTNSEQVADALREIIGTSNISFQEHFVLLCLNQAMEIIGFKRISSGGVNSCIADPKIVFFFAINTIGTTNIIVSHNHPSGSLRPSIQDIDLTKKIKEGAKLFDIQVLDHIIITENSHFSFADEGII